MYFFSMCFNAMVPVVPMMPGPVSTRVTAFYSFCVSLQRVVE